jgi:N,N'-diacetyllegionaminate synthase
MTMLDGLSVIAEAGVNHDGDVGRARELVHAAADAGADMVKFQAFRAKEIASRSAEPAHYQRQRAGAASQQDLLEALTLDLDDFAGLAELCKSANIEFLCTAFDVAMLAELVAMGMPCIKIASGELTNSPALERAAALNRPILLSTGMATLAEVRSALDVLGRAQAYDITLLHCTSLYPAPIDAINLRAMVTLRQAFDLPVGYSDHTLGDHVAITAVALGACVIEKHLTLDAGSAGPDHAASLEPEAFAVMVGRLRETAAALGDGVKAPSPDEIEMAALVRRSWHAARDLDAGHRLSEEDICLKRPATGLAPVWRALAKRKGSELDIVLTGMHCRQGASVAEMPDGATVHRAGADLGGEDGCTAAQAMAVIAAETAGLISATMPDVLLVIGDRLDMVPGVMASLAFNLPIVHLHGGEVTEGSVDDRIRNAVSKLSHLHCVASQDAHRRLVAMGEEDWRITVTGAPGLDGLLQASKESLSAFAQKFGLDETTPFRLVTVHPETNLAQPLAPLEAVLLALEAKPGSTLFTAPNSDPGGAEARRRIELFCAGHEWACFVDTLGTQHYASALHHAGVMLGNSSSGIIEAGLFGLPVINVGDRQAGRLRGANVIDVVNDTGSVIGALDRLGSCPDRLLRGTPYGDGHAAPRVVDVLHSLPERALLLRKTTGFSAADR